MRVNKRLAAFANLAFGSARAVTIVVTGLVMVPLYLRFFDLSLYGAWLASGNIVALISMFGGGLSGVVTQKLAVSYGGGEREQFARIASSGIAIAVMIAGFVAAAGMALSFWVAGLLTDSPDARLSVARAMALAAVGSGLEIVGHNFQALAQAWQRTVVPGILGLTAQVALVVGILIGLHQGFGVAALGFGQLMMAFTWLLGEASYCFFLWRRLRLPRPGVDMAQVVEIWREARNVVLAQIAEAISSRTEALVAALAVSTTASAVLVLTGRVIDAVRMFLVPLGSSVFAGVAHLSRDPVADHRRRVLSEILTVSAVTSGLGLGLALGFTEPILALWVGADKYGGPLLLLLIIASALLSIRREIFLWILFAQGRIRETARLRLTESIVRLPLLVLLAWTLGLPGIPLAGVLVTGIFATALGRLLAREIALPLGETFRPGLVGLSVALAAGLACFWFLPGFDTWHGLGAAVATFGVVVVALSWWLDHGWRAACWKLREHLRWRPRATSAA